MFNTLIKCYILSKYIYERIFTNEIYKKITYYRPYRSAFFLTEPKNIVHTDNNFTIVSDNDSDYKKELKDNDPRPHSLRDIKVM